MKRLSEQTVVPRARARGLVVQELGGEALVYDAERGKAHCLNRSAALTWRYCDGRRTLAEVAVKLSEDLGAPVDARFVRLALEQLSQRRLLETRVEGFGLASRLTRRELLRRGVPAALVLPVVASVSAPTAAQVASCTQRGGLCSTGADCCSNRCGTKTTICVDNPCRVGGSPCTQDAECCSGRCLNKDKCQN